jgi:predicted nuclease with TOPRIM domain
METLYAGLLIFGGAILVFLGVFLFASDRKVRIQQRRLDELRRKHRVSEARRAEVRSPVRLTPPNKELVEKNSSPSGRHGSPSDHHELHEKIVNLRKQLHTNETRLSESSREIQKIGQRNAKLQTEVANLKQQLHASQTKAQEFEAEQQRLLERLQKTESTVAATASQQKEGIGHSSQTQSELAQTESQIDHLATRNDALLPEVGSLSKKLAANRTRVGEPERRQNSIKSDNQQFRAANHRVAAEITPVRHQLQKSASQFGESPKQNQHTALPDSNSRPARTLTAQSSGERNGPFGIVSAAASIAIVGAIAIGFARTGADKSAGNMPQRPSPSVTERATILETSVEPDIPQTPGETETRKAEVLKPTSKFEPRIKGTFETIRPTELFNGPSEESALIGTLGAGMKINVINFRDGWLEVRSKHGTSGFMRQEAAVRVSEDWS